jgi:hypothetical protein
MPTALAMQPTTAALTLTQRGDTNAILSLQKESLRMTVLAKVDAMLRIESCIVGGMSQQDAIGEVTRGFTGKRGFSRGNLLKDWMLWRDGGQKPDVAGKKTGEIFPPRDWHIFLPNYNNGNRDAALRNPDLVAHVRRLWSDTCREDATGNAVQARLLDEWYAGQPIPPWGTIYEWSAKQGRPVPVGFPRRPMDYPAGLSVANIRRMLPQARATRALVQRGEHAAHDHWGDQLLRDRSRLMPFQLITLDDVRCDIRVVMELPGRQAQIVYPEAVFAIDVATGLIIAKGIVGHYERPEDMDGGKAGTKRGIQQADTRMVLLSILERFGLPQDWQMNVLLENASASLSETDMRMFEKLTGIRIDNTGLVHRKLVESGFQEQGGQPWHKGWIESFFRLLHTTTNHLPGTVGRRYDLTAGDRDDAARYALSTVRKALAQGREISELRLPILTMQEYHDLLDEYIVRLNWRTEHRLQGFCRVYETEIQPGEWIRHDDPRAADLLDAGARLSARMEAPAERFQRLMQGHRMQHAHPRQLMPLALDKRPVSVRAGKVTIRKTGQDDLIFRDAESAAAIEAFDGMDKPLLGFISADESCIHLFTRDDDMRYIASPQNVVRADLTNPTEILCRSGEVDRGRDVIRDQVADLLEPRNQKFAEMREHNKRVLNTPRGEVSDVIARAESTHRAEASKRKTMSGRMRKQLDAQASVLASVSDAEDRPMRSTNTPHLDPIDLLN